MPRIRVVLIGVPHLLADVIGEICESHPELELTVLPARVSPLEGVARTSADVLVAMSGPGLADGVALALERFPHLRAIVLIDAGRRAVLHELVPRRELLSDLSAQTLLTAMTTAADWTLQRISEHPT